MNRQRPLYPFAALALIGVGSACETVLGPSGGGGNASTTMANTTTSASSGGGMGAGCSNIPDAAPPFCAGVSLWSKQFGDAVFPVGIVADHTRHVLVTGTFRDAIDFGGMSLQSTPGTKFTHDVFTAKLDADGSYAWSRRFGDHLGQYCNGVAVDASGDVFIVGSYLGSLDFGLGPLIRGQARRIGWLRERTTRARRAHGRGARVRVPSDIPGEAHPVSAASSLRAPRRRWGGGVFVSASTTTAG